MMKRIVACGLAAFAVLALSTASSSAALIAHWELEETNMTEYAGGVFGPVVETVSGSTAGRYWAAAGQSNYIAGVINQSGPGGSDARAYRFDRANNYRVSTYSIDVVPATDDFFVEVTFKKTYDGYQGHLFSNNQGQNGRANLFVESTNAFEGTPMRLKWFIGNSAGNFALDGTTDLSDDTWYTASIGREGNDWELRLNRNLEASGTYTGAVGQATSCYWTIGGDRGGANPFDGEISDVKVYDVIPEPGSLMMMAIPFVALLLRRKFRR